MSYKKLTSPPCDIAHLKARCDEVGDCWEWRNTYTKNGTLPCISFRLMVDGKIRGVQIACRQLVWWLSHGHKPHLGMSRVMKVTCGNHRCINPDHVCITGRRKACQAAAQAGKYSSPVKGARIAAKKRAQSKLSDEAVREIRESDENSMTVASKYDISRSYVYMLRAGQWRRDSASANPFAALAMWRSA